MSNTKIDPYNIEAFEKSLNDSATRVSTIWVSFVIFSLYLLVAATTVDDRQLLLAEPVKLPVLNIDLPLWGFFVLAPILFLIFHAYVLIQVILLARTAAAYNDALNRVVPFPSNNAIMRQRLANTLFAQIFAGSPRERNGWLGWLLKGMAWITLAIAPVLLLLAFQIAFLPYHSHLATWTHRLLILVELTAVFVLWPLIFDNKREFEWPKLKHWFKRLIVLAATTTGFLAWPFITRQAQILASPKRRWRRQFSRSGRLAFPVIACLLFAAGSLAIATFPGEPHVNLATGYPPFSTQCERWLIKTFDRLILPNVDVVDDEKLAKIVRATEEKGQMAHQGEATRSFRGRDLRCGIFSTADFRHTDFSNANLVGATLDSVELQGATLDGAQLQEAYLVIANFAGASLARASFQNADLTGADLSKSQIQDSEFQGADLSSAVMQGAILSNALFYAADMSSTQFQGASLYNVGFQGANLDQAQFQGAHLTQTRFQGSTLSGADFGGATLREVQLQGAILDGAKLTIALVEKPFVWSATLVSCNEARVIEPQSKRTIDVKPNAKEFIFEPIEATPASIEQFILRITKSTPLSKRAQLQKLLDARLRDRSTEAENSANWNNCSARSLSSEDYYQKLVQYVVREACAKAWNSHFGIDAIIWSKSAAEDTPHSYIKALAQGLLGIDRANCQTEIQLTEKRKAELTKLLNRPDRDQYLK